MDADEAKLEKDLEGWDLPSLDLAFSEAKRILDGQFNAVDGIDTKASILVGFSGVILAAVFNTAPNLIQHPNLFTLILVGLSALSVVVAGVAAFMAYWIRVYQNAPAIARMTEKYVNWKEKHSKYVLLGQFSKAYDSNENLIAEKAKRLKWSMALLIFSFALFAFASIYQLSQASIVP